MSDEDSLSEMNVAPARLMPKSPSITEHHRILNLSAVHHGNTLSTIKAHKVRQDHFEKQLDEIRSVRDDVWELKAELESQREASRAHADQISRAMSAQGALIGEIGQKLAVQATGVDVKKAIIAGVFSLLMAFVTAYCGYTWGHVPDAKYEAPTHQQAQQRDLEIQQFDPDNAKRVNK